MIGVRHGTYIQCTKSSRLEAETKHFPSAYIGDEVSRTGGGECTSQRRKEGGGLLGPEEGSVLGHVLGHY